MSTVTEPPHSSEPSAANREDPGGRVALADSLRLPCGLVLANQIAKAAMTECLADPRTNDANARHERLYRRWARGGVGLMVTGNVMVDRRYLDRTTNVVLDAHTDRAALGRWAQAAQSTGVPTLVQVNHPGRQCTVFVSRTPVAPSAVRVKMLGAFVTPRALSDDEVDALVTQYARVASEAIRAGFAGVQIHAAHGYLASQFLSPRANVRTDRWGGPLENRVLPNQCGASTLDRAGTMTAWRSRTTSRCCPERSTSYCPGSALLTSSQPTRVAWSPPICPSCSIRASASTAR